MMDIDKQYLTETGTTGATYYNCVAKLPVHGSVRPALRNYLFYDWSVRSMRMPF